MIASNRRRAVFLFTLVALCVAGAGWASSSWESAVQAYNDGQWTLAVEELDAVLEEHPEYSPAHVLMANALVKDGKSLESVVFYERAIALDPTNESNRLFLGRTLFQMGRVRNSMLVLGPIRGTGLSEEDHVVEWFNLLKTIASRPNPTGVLVSSLEAALDLAPKEVDLWTGLGRVQQVLNNPGESMAAWEAALSLAPSEENRSRYLRTAKGFGEDRSDSERLSWYLQAAKTASLWESVKPDTALSVAECWIGAKECDSATPWLKTAKAGSHRARAAMYLGECAAAAKKFDTAIAELQEARSVIEKGQMGTKGSARGPDLTERVLLALGEAHHAASHYDAAIEAYRAAGATERVATVVTAREVAKENEEFDAKVAECKEREAGFQDLIAGSSDLEGTDEWDVIQKSYEVGMADCRPYL